jgi:uncharacterized protein
VRILLSTNPLTDSKKIWFYSDHTRIAGLLWIPKSIEPGKKLPAVVLARGFGSLKEFVNPGFATRLNKEGYIALAFDYRGLGESEGIPGNLLPLDHCEDIRSAITFLESVSEVDTEKIGLIGDSMGASHVIYAAAFDKRAKCVISYGGPGNMDRWFRGLIGYERYLEWKSKIEENRRQRVLTGKSQYVPTFDFLAFSKRERREWDEMKKEFPGIMPDISVDTVEHYLEYEPELVVDRISPRPLFLVTAETSVIVPPDESDYLFQKAKEPKKLWIIPHSTADFRYATHSKGHGYSEPIAKEFIDWLNKWIPP